jgi:hypothetical protein
MSHENVMYVSMLTWFLWDAFHPSAALQTANFGGSSNREKTCV